MIHLLKIGPASTIQEIKKLARRYAMTGGYEVELEDDLSQVQLLELRRVYEAELDLIELAKKKTSIAGRVIGLLQEALV